MKRDTDGISLFLPLREVERNLADRRLPIKYMAHWHSEGAAADFEMKITISNGDKKRESNSIHLTVGGISYVSFRPLS